MSAWDICIDEQQNDIDELKSEVDEQQIEIDELKSEVDELKSEIEAMKDKIKNLTERLSETDSDSDNGVKLESNDDPVIYSSTRTTPQTNLFKNYDRPIHVTMYDKAYWD